MKKLVIAVMLLWPFAAAHQASAVEMIGAISSAGITCTGQLPEKISRRFVSQAKRACEKRATCSIRATYVGGARKFARYGCTNFYVVANCGGKDKEFRSQAIKGKLRVIC